MKRRTVLAAAAALPAAGLARAGHAPTKTKINFWHAFTGPLGEELKKVATGFNSSQNEVELELIFKGTYPETLTGANRSTVQRNLTALQATGLLREVTGQGRYRLWTAQL